MFKSFLAAALLGVVMSADPRNTNKGNKYAKDADGNC